MKVNNKSSLNSVVSGQVCRICNSTSMSFLYKAKGHHLLQCKECSFVQTLEIPSDDELASLYAQLHCTHMKFRAESAVTKENSRRANLISAWLPRGTKVLDAGCASGDFLCEIHDDYDAYGVDISFDAIQSTKERLPNIAENLFVSRLEDLGDMKPRFDAVCIWDVIEHICNPVEVFTRLMALIKPGGYMFLSTPDVGSLAARVMKANWAFMIPPYHLSHFSDKSLQEMITRTPEAKIVKNINRGKWTNFSFLLYKLNQMNKALFPSSLLNFSSATPLKNLNIYVPTHDIKYVVIKKS